MELRLEKTAAPGLERGDPADNGHIGVLGSPDHLAVGSRCRGRDPVEIETQCPCERQAAVVRDEHRRPPLHAVTCGQELGGAAEPLRGFRVDVRIVEEPEAELVAQETAHGLVDPLFGDPSVADELDEQLR